MEALAMVVSTVLFIGLPVALILLARRSRRARKAPRGGWLEQRLTTAEGTIAFQEARLDEYGRRLAALEQAQAPLYRVQ